MTPATAGNLKCESLDALEYIQEFYKLDFKDRNELGDELMLNQLGYFILDARKIDTYVSTPHIANILYKADKIYLNSSYSYVYSANQGLIDAAYSYVYAALEALIENNLHLQINMLDIEINIWNNINYSMKLLSHFTNLKLLYIDGCNCQRNQQLPNITAHLPESLEALSIVNLPYYNKPFSQNLRTSNLKILKLMSLKFNQELRNLPPTLETLIIESGAFNQPLDNLPCGLKHLIVLCPLFTQHLDNLPHGLEYFAGLHFNCFVYPEETYNLELVNLPSSIKTIMLDKFLFKKHNEILKEIYKESTILFYEDFNNFELIINKLLDNKHI